LGRSRRKLSLAKEFFPFHYKNSTVGLYRVPLSAHYREIASNPPATLRALPIPNAIEIYYKLF
jgi:hypothetical protein